MRILTLLVACFFMLGGSYLVTGTTDDTLVHATDCTTLTCSATVGYLCFEEDDDTLWACDGPATTWVAVGGTTHTGTVTWGGTALLESGVAFQFGDGTDATLTHTYSNTGTDVDVAYSTGAVDLDAAVTATSFTADASATPSLGFDDSDGADGFVALNANDADDSIMTLGVDDSNGDDQTYLELDGVEETTESKYPFLGGKLIHLETDDAYTIGTDNDYEAYGGVFVNNEDNGDGITFTLPAAVAGMHVTISCTTSDEIITVELDNADTIIVDGDAAGGAGNPLVSDADEGNTVELIAIDGDYWVVVNMVGTWGIP